MTEKQKDYFTSREAAERLDVSVSTIQLWTNNGLLRAWTTAGGHRRIVRSSVEEILGQQQAVSSVQKPDEQLSIVVVEDNAQQLRLYEKQFLAWHMNTRVVMAKDGYQGLIKIGSTLPDVIITDLKMPNMDGFQMIRALKELPELEHSIIIVVSGLKEDEVKTRGGLPEGVYLFTKPIPFKNLETLIREKTRTKVA
ncbi:MAG TPA: response regulator [Gammaproteobacteria bacterium]|nr:response regulator [Gammaproteobacteria bacterium]